MYQHAADRKHVSTVIAFGLDERYFITNAPCSRYLDNFGVSAADVTDAFMRSKQLFALSDEEKAALAPYTVTNTGFSQLATQRLNTRRPPDLKEAEGECQCSPHLLPHSVQCTGAYHVIRRYRHVVTPCLTPVS